MKRVFFLLLICLCFTGCFLDYHRDGKYAEDAIDVWFNYKNGNDDLGKTRRTLENISLIKDKECKYYDNSNNIYIYKCKITYTPIGETIIPLSKNENINVFVALKFKDKSLEYEYRVYNSKSVNKIWLYDEELGYEG